MADAALVTVIDGTPEHRGQVCQALTSLYRVAAFADAREASAHLHAAEIVMVDETALPLGGRETVKRMRADNALCNKRIIGTSDLPDSAFISRAKEYGCDAALAKPYRRSELISTISGLINTAVEGGWDLLGDTQRTALRSTLDTFNGISDLIDRAQPIEFADVRDACSPLVKAVQQDDFKAILSGVRGHDNYSYVHSLRVATFLSLLGHAMGLQSDDLLVLSTGGLLHDVGKMSIPHEVLNKPGRLDEAEFTIMRSHVTGSVNYIQACPTIPQGVAIIAGQHHEKLDGTGYPHGLKGTELNELARMAAIVDVFSALTDRRCYKPPMEPEKALRIMKEEMSNHLDRNMLRLFVELLLSSGKDVVAG